MATQESELVLNPDGSVYHLALKPQHIADHVILVGDPGRVSVISSFFDTIEHQISNREFVTHTGTYKGVRITALATGIGTDNLDIVVTELDAAVNMDLTTRTPLPNPRSLKLIRLGTCGALQYDLEVDHPIVTEWSIGLDGVRHFYDIEEHEDEERIRTAFESFLGDDIKINPPYAARASQSLVAQFGHLGPRGITLTANGFFGPQGRSIRIPLAYPCLNDDYAKFETHGARILNYEMESSALYALGGALGHECLCMCIVVANRKAKKFSKNYHPAMKKLIGDVLESIVSN